MRTTILWAAMLFSASAAQAATLNFVWDAVPTNATGYRLYWGNAPGVSVAYGGNSVDVGNVTTYQLSGLTDGLPYYVVVRAYSSSGTLSAPSIEVSGWLVSVFGFRRLRS